MKSKHRIISVIMSAAMAVSALTLPAYASDKSAGSTSNTTYYRDTAEVKDAVKKFVELYKTDAKKGERYFCNELTYDDGAAHRFLSADTLAVFQKNADYGAVIKHDENDRFDSREYPWYGQFAFTFFCADGKLYETPPYDVDTTKALSVKRIIKDSKIPDSKSIAAAELRYYPDGINKIGIELGKLDNGWLGMISSREFVYPTNGVYLAETEVKSYGYLERAFYINKDGSLMCKAAVIDGVRYNFEPDGTFKGRYNGWTKTKSGKRRYYKAGVALSGWQIVDGKRYYFGKDGYAATGKAKIAGCTYTFSSKGVWSGKRSNAGGRPSDFEAGCGTYCFKYESSDKKMTRTINYEYTENGKYEPVYAYGDYKLSSLDKQILWSIITEYDLKSADTKERYGTKYIDDVAKKHGIEEIESWDPSVDCSFGFVANGKTYSFVFSDETEQLVGIDKTMTGLWAAYNYLNRLVRSTDAFKALPPIDESLYLE